MSIRRSCGRSSLWRNPDGSFSHHLLDPSSGTPAWTGLIGATAIADSALEAETLSKMALLLGPAGACEVLSESGVREPVMNAGTANTNAV